LFLEIKKIGVIGAGTMGNGLAQIATQIGCSVVMWDIEDRFVENGLKSLTGFLSKRLKKAR
jgi:3-hydroxybutyryl-CoA dehydrogenase